jgi:uncharacterized membrane protein
MRSQSGIDRASNRTSIETRMRNIVILAMVLLAPTIAAAVQTRLMGRSFLSTRFAARLGLALVLFLTGVAHFVQTEEMAMLLPAWVPAGRGLILLSGVFEVAAGFGLLWDRAARISAAVLVVFFVLVFPANVWAALNYVPYGGHGAGPMYLLVRGPLQVLFILWSWRIAAKPI